jgi:ribonuclease T2
MRYDLAVLGRKPITIILVLVLLLISSLAARKHHPQSPDNPSTFDYYLLSLSWAPTYCAAHPDDNSTECRPGEHKTFVLHGLWPQSQSGAPPENCGNARPVSQQIVRHMLAYFPSAGLVQHEWAKHGTCSSLSAGDYFAKVEQAFQALQVPDAYRNVDQQTTVSRHDIEANFASANHAPEAAFRLSCHNGELVSAEACMSKSLQFQACSQSVRECPANQVTLLPPR